MVEVDGGNDAHRIALLGVELFGNGFVGNGAGFVHVDGAGVGLVAGGDGGGGGGGVGGKGVGVISHGGAGGSKFMKLRYSGPSRMAPACASRLGWACDSRRRSAHPGNRMWTGSGDSSCRRQ
mgnify:CR=1 FL=1